MKHKFTWNAGDTGRCPGCGCTEPLEQGGYLCRDCARENHQICERIDGPKSWQEQLAVMENNPDCI